VLGWKDCFASVICFERTGLDAEAGVVKKPREAGRLFRDCPEHVGLANYRNLLKRQAVRVLLGGNRPLLSKYFVGMSGSWQECGGGLNTCGRGLKGSEGVTRSGIVQLSVSEVKS
jgi:hypothetical protein